MGRAPAAPRRRSRFQVLTAQEPALTADHHGTLYRFDGFFFTRRRERDPLFSIVPSWQTPSHGWMVMAECPCVCLMVAPDMVAAGSLVTAPHLAA